MPSSFAQRSFAAVTVALAMTTMLPAARADEPAITLKFSQFFRLPIGPRGLEVSQQLHAADGRLVRIVGYMVHQEDEQRGGFALTAPAGQPERAG